MDTPQVMRMPRFARGLQFARIGVFLMLATLVIQIFVTIKAITGSSSAMDWIQYLYWVNVASVGLMALGTLLAVFDLNAAKQPSGRLVVSIVAFGVTILIWVWSFHVLDSLFDVGKSIVSDDLDQIAALTAEAERAADRVDNLKWFVILKDLAYPIGLAGIVHAIRQTAIANDHYALRDAAGNISTLVVGMCICDVVAQLITMVPALGLVLALLMLGALLFTLGLWIYVHLRLAKFFKAAAILVHEEHNLPVATVIVRDKPAATEATAADAAPVIRQSGPIPRPRTSSGSMPRPETGPIIRPTTAPTFAPSAPSAPAFAPPAPPPAPPPVVVDNKVSRPVVTVAAELRAAPAPRAEATPGAPFDEPKLLR